MSDPMFDADDDAATPLTAEERAQLIPTYITNRAQLNEAEQRNITEADSWAFTRRRNVLDTDFLRRLHRRMFGKVWKWAGLIRMTARNIGVAPVQIAIELRTLIGAAGYWIEHETFAPDEIAVRFHHRLVFIHPFANGNGRHARLAADLFSVSFGRDRFSWGRANLTEPAAARAAYIAALKAADNHDIAKLLAFARS